MVSDDPPPDEPLHPTDVRRRVRQAHRDDVWYLTKHAKRRMAERDITLPDLANILAGGHCAPDKTTFEHGTWRYRIETTKMSAAVSFDWYQGRLVVVTVMRHDEK